MVVSNYSELVGLITEVRRVQDLIYYWEPIDIERADMLRSDLSLLYNRIGFIVYEDMRGVVCGSDVLSG